MPLTLVQFGLEQPIEYCKLLRIDTFRAYLGLVERDDAWLLLLKLSMDPRPRTNTRVLDFVPAPMTHVEVAA